jgi:hypothetical protein
MGVYDLHFYFTDFIIIEFNKLNAKTTVCESQNYNVLLPLS